MKPHQIAESVWFSLAHKILPILAFLVFAVPGMVLIGFLRGRNVSGAENYGGVVVLLGLPAAFFIKLVLFNMSGDQGRSFGDACAEVFYSWILYLHFMPIIGTLLTRWAAAKRARRNPFVVRDKEK